MTDESSSGGGGRPLNLKFDLTVENMPRFAEDIVAVARRVGGVDLDFSRASIGRVDSIIQGFAEDGVSEWDIAETLVGFGAYVGEVFVRDAKARWKDIRDTKLAALLGPLPMVVEMPSGRIWNPIGKVFKRVTDPADNLSYFFAVVDQERE